MLANRIEDRNQCRKIISEFSLIFSLLEVGTTVASELFSFIKGLGSSVMVFK